MPFNGLPPLSSAHSCRLPGTTTSGQVREPAFHCYSPGVSDYLPKMRNCSRLIQKGVHSGQFALVWSRCFLLVKGEKMCRKVCTSDSLEFLLLWVWWKGGGGSSPNSPTLPQRPCFSVLVSRPSLPPCPLVLSEAALSDSPAYTAGGGPLVVPL